MLMCISQTLYEIINFWLISQCCCSLVTPLHQRQVVHPSIWSVAIVKCHDDIPVPVPCNCMNVSMRVYLFCMSGSWNLLLVSY